MWIWNAYFWPLGAQMGPNFRFYVLFLFSDKKQRVWYITRGIYPAFLENRIFFTLFCTIASFYKISHRSTTSGHSKKPMWFSALESKTAYAQMFFLHFEVKSRFYGENKKKFEKNREISIIFPLRGAISREPLVRFRWFFLQTALNFILFSY